MKNISNTWAIIALILAVGTVIACIFGFIGGLGIYGFVILIGGLFFAGLILTLSAICGTLSEMETNLSIIMAKTGSTGSSKKSSIVAEDGSWICGSCGKQNEKWRDICPFCGTRR